MATISEILALESQSDSQIHLYREGIFWKAYQQSAYQILQQRNRFKVSKKHVKAVGQQIVSIGFPDSTLSQLFVPELLTQTTDKQLTIACSPIDMLAYQAWFDSVEITEKVKQTEKKENTDIVAPIIPHRQQAEATNKEEIIIRRLRAFRIEHSTPMDCMLFLVSIRNEFETI